MMRGNILLISYVDLSKPTSGSSVRPAKMVNAFRQLGYTVYELSGNQMSKDRKKKIKKIYNLINSKKLEFCYIESPTYPIMLHEDRKLIRALKQYSIPMGYFYRDFYRKFPDEFPRRKDALGRLKEFGLDILQYLTDRVIKNCDIVYVPSIEAKKILCYKNIKALPPAGEDFLNPNKEINHNVIYVGGVTEQYDGAFLLDVMHEVHRRDGSFQFIIVCRQSEWEKFEHKDKSESWVHVYHVSSDELSQYYNISTLALSGKQKSRYNELAISVKTFEYMSYGLPQIVVNSKAIAELIEKEHVGIAVEQNVEAFADEIIKICTDSKLYMKYQNSIRESLLNKNLWIHRAETVSFDLMNVKYEKNCR